MPKNTAASQKQPTPQLPSLTLRWVRLVLGFSVSVTIGLAPYLGRLDVPLFTPMLSLIPDSVQPIAIPLAAAAMGIVALLVQWHGTYTLGQRELKAWFGRTLSVCVVALIALAGIETIAIVRVDVPALNRTVTFAVGPYSPGKSPCSDMSRADCIRTQLSLNEARIDSYFGETAVNVTKFVLVLVYTIFMSTFGALVGLLLLAREAAQMSSPGRKSPRN